MTPLDDLREEFLSFLADGDLTIDYDADLADSGRQIDCSTFEIKGALSILKQMCTALGIFPNRGESLDDCITRLIEAHTSEMAEGRAREETQNG